MADIPAMITKQMKTIEVHYPIIQLLMKGYKP